MRWPKGGFGANTGIEVYSPSAWPGSRAPHAWIDASTSTLDLFGNGFTLLRFGDATSEAMTAAAADIGVPLRVVAIADPAIAARYERPLVLVRPDGHVAWRGETIRDDARDGLDRVRGAALPVRA